jgi:hypothetical protein
LPKRHFGSHEPLRDFSKSTATKWSGAAREKIFLKKVLSFSERRGAIRMINLQVETSELLIRCQSEPVEDLQFNLKSHSDNPTRRTM